MRIVAITQARMASTRLPRKVLLEIVGKSLLQHHLERVSRAPMLDAIVVATTVNDVDNPIVELTDRLGFQWHRGSEDDVLSRYYFAAKEYGADVVVRVTSDCPVIDPQVMGEVIEYFRNHADDLDYVSNCRLEQTYPRGMDTEVFSFSSLERAHKEAREPLEREHVTPFIWNRPADFRLANLTYSIDQSRHRWTVDTADDLDLVQRLFGELYAAKPGFTLADCLAVLERHPEWEDINRHVEQKRMI